MTLISNCFRDHLDGAAGAFLSADAATLAIIQVELETHAGPELDHGIVGTDAVAIIALETVSAGQAAARLIERIALVEALDHFLEGRGTARQFQQRLQRFGGLAAALHVVCSGDS